MSEKTRIEIVGGILILVLGAISWSAAALVFGGEQWFCSHWHVICGVLGAAGILVIAGIILMFRVDKSPVVKTVAACAILAAAIAAPAKAGEPTQYEDYSAYHAVARFWNWVSSYFTIESFTQGATSTNQGVPQSQAGAWGSSFQSVDMTGNGGGVKPNTKEE